MPHPAANPQRPVTRLGIWRFAAACLALAGALASSAEAYKTDIGYDALLAEFPGQLPDGAGVLVSMVEADEDKDPNNSRPT